MQLQKGQRVKAFDHLLYKNDEDTPMSFTMRPGKVVACYEHTDGRLLVDVMFDHRPERISVGHFAHLVELICRDDSRDVVETT